MKDEIGEKCLAVGVCLVSVIVIFFIVSFIYWDFSIFSNEYFLRAVAVFSIPTAYSAYDIYTIWSARNKRGES